MFLCRTGRLSAAALDQAFRSTGSFLVQVKANRLRDVTLTLRKDYTSQGHRCFCASVGGGDSTRAHLRKQQQQQPQPDQNRDSSSGFVIADWGHSDRVAVNLSKRVQSEGGNRDIGRQPLVRANRRHSSGGEPVGNVLFTGNWGVSSLRCSTRTMQTRASSTTKRDPGEEHSVDSNKGEEQNLKEASTTSSSTLNAPREPEAGKPNKTQQLKKVFKEYGAVGVSFHICISLMSLGMFYLLISSGIDMTAVLCKLGFSEAVVRSKMAAGTSTFVLAYAIHKLFAPVRISITLVSVPLIVRYFRKTGLFKPPTPAP
ncbi:protein FAM210B, mitochondrial isoform X1 [Dicentrarchus labrax]|uniref:Family with sequence similarity 210 member B n=1 Tax=Dicentrarchus labrax TaxID=13489 RepID=A0A8P4KHA1_DICLA|nr:protein FAM210B, mitochondrial isoform X1 [Dicentrarchus labrax]